MGTTFPPDAYTIVNGTWGTDADYETGSGALTGDGYIEFKGTTPASDPAIWYSDYIPVMEGHPYSMTASLYAQNITAGNYLQVGVNWYQNDLSACATASSTLFNSELDAATTWESHGGVVDAPSTARYAKPWVVKANNAFTARVDRADFKHVPFAFRAYRNADQSVSGADTIEFNAEEYDYGSWYDTTNYYAVVPVDGVYTFHVQAEIEQLDTDEYFQLTLWAGAPPGGTRWALGPYLHSPADNTDVTNMVSVTQYFNTGDQIVVACLHGHGANLNIGGGANSDQTWFSGQLIE